MKRYSVSRKILSVTLGISFLLGCTACKKKTTQGEGGREILKSDTFFESEIFELKIPIDETKKLEYQSVENVHFLGDIIIANYTLTYEFPEEALNGGNWDDINWEEYNRSGIAKFSLEGEYLGDLQSGSDPSANVAVDNDGNLAVVNTSYDESFMVNGISITIQDDSGNTIKEIPLEMPPNPNITYISQVQFLPDGRIAVQCGFGGPLGIYDENGKHLSDIGGIDRGIIGNIFEYDGKYYAFSMPNDSLMDIEFYIHEVDLKTGEMKPGKPSYAVNNPYLLAFTESGAYTTTPNGIAKFNPVSGETEEILNWNQTDVNHGILNSVLSAPVNDDEINAIARKFSSDFIHDTFYVIRLKRAEKNPHAGKKIMCVGGIGLSSGFYDYMYEYNSNADNKMRIEATDYTYSLEDGTSLDKKFETNLTSRINLMILSGEAPDILVNFAGFDQYANDNILVDLNTYIDGGNGLDRSEYFDNIFHSMEVNGKLYYAPMSFNLQGYMANTKYIQADSDWTFDDLDKAASSLPDGVLLIPPEESSELLKKYMSSDLTTYMDYVNRKVSFNSEGMIRVLEESKKYAAKEDLSDRNILTGISTTSAYGGLNVYDTADLEEIVPGVKPVVKTADYLKNGAAAMISAKVDSLNDFSIYKGLTNGNSKYLGYPTLKGNGILAYSVESMAIVADSPYKDEAWEIIRSFYSSEAQSAMTQSGAGSFPLKTSVFEDNMMAEKEKISKAYDDYRQDMAKTGQVDWIVYPAADGDIDELREIIKNVKASYHTDAAVMDVILEEVPGYFLGSRSEEEVLKNIDKRALLIVQER